MSTEENEQSWYSHLKSVPNLNTYFQSSFLSMLQRKKKKIETRELNNVFNSEDQIKFPLSAFNFPHPGEVLVPIG